MIMAISCRRRENDAVHDTECPSRDHIINNKLEQRLYFFIAAQMPRLPGSFEYYWLGNLSSLGRNKEIQPPNNTLVCFV